MRVVLDTNILISALISPKSVARQIYEAARSGRIALVTCDAQLDEFRWVTRYPKVQRYIGPAEAGAMLNELRELAVYIEPGLSIRAKHRCRSGALAAICGRIRAGAALLHARAF